MAAHLKKRALTEYSHTVVEDVSRPAKQLQLVCRKPRSSDALTPGSSGSAGDWSPSCLSTLHTGALMQGLLSLHTALPLQPDIEREGTEALLLLLKSLTSGSSSSTLEVDPENGGGTGEDSVAPPVSHQDILSQVVAVLPLVIKADPTRVDSQLASSAVDALCKCGWQWLQRERQCQVSLTQPQPLPVMSCPDSRVLAQAVLGACSVALHIPAQQHTAPSMVASPQQQALRLALACLTLHQHHLVKVSCLEVAGSLVCSLDGGGDGQENSRPSSALPRLCGRRERSRTHHTTTTAEVIVALLLHCTHHDNRVRTAAFKAMAMCEESNINLPPQAYTEVCHALDDDYQCVREAAILLLQRIALADGERRIPAAVMGEEHERLADNAFFKICGCMNDVSVRVRVTAATALSAIPGVSHHVLLQTLDKKLFSNMRRKLSYHERQAALVSSGQWSRGREWGEDGIRETVSAENTSLTHSAGAFVHGLEDECLEVRNASLDALSVLAEGSQMFANQCLDFLVDMFNDEIEEVRLKAVQVLQRIVRHIRLQEDQLDEILHALEDSWQCIRESVHALLGTCRLTTTTCLQVTVTALIDNIRRYPQDVPSIQQCMVSLGGRQAGLVAGLVPQLLLIHPYFDAVQPSLHQPEYICKLLLVLNAAAKMPTILPVLEEHTLNHYAYLRDTLPHLVPQLKVSVSVPIAAGDVLSNTADFLQQSLLKLRRLERASTQLRLTLYSSVYADLQKLAALDPTLSAAAEFAALYTRCTLLLTRLLNCSSWLQQESSGNNVQQLVTLTFRLVHAFTGLGPGDRACARGIRLRALALQLVYVVNGSTGSALGLCEAFLNHARPTKESYCATAASPNSKLKHNTIDDSAETVRDEFLTAALNQLKDERRPGTVARTLQPLLSDHPPTPLPTIVHPRAIHQASAKITEPKQDSEVIHKLTAGLVLAVPLDAQLRHIPDPGAVRIRIAYPDQSTQLVVPRRTHLQPTEEQHCYRLLTTVLLTAAVWSEACEVQLSLVLDLSPAGPKRKHDPHTIDLSEPTKLMVWPKPMKKGI